jgi:hypothetical protein
LKKSLLLVVFGVAVACGGKLTVDRDEPSKPQNLGGATPAGSGGASTTGIASEDTGGHHAAGGLAGAGSVPVASGAPSMAGDGPLGGAPGNGGTLGEGGASGSPGDAGSSGAVACNEQDVPGDCHACDPGPLGARQVDQADVPTPANPCLAGTCNAAGTPGSEPRDPGATCHDDASGVMCDGAGRCVQCLKSEHCAANQYCAKDGSCGPAPCTDLDCGGACPLCATGKKCLSDSDCQSGACDSATLRCIDDHCKDHHQNFGETDADCGVTGNCGACKLGQGCYWNIDCVTNACDAVSQVCITNQCADHHVDGDESDVDCGGGTCAGCPNYKKCKTPFDCADGLCSLSLPHLCTP